MAADGAADGSLRDEVAHRAGDGAEVSAEPAHEIHQMGSIADDRGGDQPLAGRIGRHLAQGKIRVEKLAVLLEAMDMEDLAQAPFGDPLLHLTDRGRVAEGEAELGAHALVLGRACRLECGRSFGRERLFGEHMLARRYRIPAQRKMGMGRGADIDHLHLGIGQQRLVIGIDPAGAEFRRHGARPLGHDIADGDEVDTLMGLIARQMCLLGPGMSAEQADTQPPLRHGRVLPISAT